VIMDHEKFSELDELLTRVRGSALTSLTAVVDVESRLQVIRRACAAGQGGEAAATQRTSTKTQ